MHCCTYKHTYAQTHILRFYIIGLYRCMCVYLYYVYTCIQYIPACMRVHRCHGHNMIYGVGSSNYSYGFLIRVNTVETPGLVGMTIPFQGKITHVWTITGPSASSWLHFTNSRLHLDHGCVLPVSALCLRCANSPSWARNLRNTRLHTDPATAKQCFWTLNASTACQRNAGIPTNEWLSENTTPWHFQIPLATQ